MMATFAHSISLLLIWAGIGFWVWGTWPLLGNRSVLFKLHSLSVSDTLGSMMIVVGLLIRIPREWPLLLLALIALAIWNTVLGYVLAYCSSRRVEKRLSDRFWPDLVDSPSAPDISAPDALAPDILASDASGASSLYRGDRHG